jgi:hypothetical protein
MSGYAEANMAKYCAASAGILPITPSVSISAASLPSSPGAGAAAAAAAAAQQSNARKRSGEFSGEDESPTSKQKATFESLAAQNPFPSSTTSHAAAEEEGSHLAEMNECAM